MDNNVPPDNTLLVVDALIKANKDFDLLMIPNAGHGFGAASNYMMRRRWDYFVRWLLDARAAGGLPDPLTTACHERERGRCSAVCIAPALLCVSVRARA